jgi:hypothetical protein
VYEVGDEIDRLYFPTSGIASLQMIMKDGRAIVGSDGALGAMAAHAPCPATVRCVVRSTITAFAISALEYRRAAAGEAALQMLVIQYQDTLLSQTRASAVRYASLSVDQRLAACLLDVSSLLASDSVSLTQDHAGGNAGDSPHVDKRSWIETEGCRGHRLFERRDQDSGSRAVGKFGADEHKGGGGTVRLREEAAKLETAYLSRGIRVVIYQRLLSTAV